MSDYSASPSDHPLDFPPPPKRKATAAGLDANPAARSVKRRASKACQCCRARKVRCNVTEHGAPCTNCRLDQVECIVSESRRKKKWTKEDQQTDSPTASSSATRRLASRDALDSIQTLQSAAEQASHESDPRRDEHVPHSIYQSHRQRVNSVSNFSDMHRRPSITSQINGLPIMPFSPYAENRPPFFANMRRKSPTSHLPRFIKPLPSRIGPDEVAYLERKGALTVPTGTLRSEMLRAYIEFVHPYMPLLDLHDFLTIIDKPDGSCGNVSLILFQAVMFAGSAFVDMKYLQTAGYTTRKGARKDFFQKTRILYDFDYESDRVSLVQALLLLTYYYETPDDQKDTWHWMGVATSVAHTIGLHRNPDNTNLDTKRVKLWKRIWWSTYMRDRLIALGMRRPTRIKAEDFDVPMLTLDDFEIAAMPDSITCIPADCRVAKDVEIQRQLAIMCIEKARLCLRISHVLSKQYCVLNNNHGLQNDRTTMMLLPKKLDPETSEVKACDHALQKWVSELPEEARYTDKPSGEDAIDLAKSLLHMIFFTTLSALHRPQVLPNSQGGGGATSAPAKPNVESDLLDISRRNVRRAASAITSIAQRLDARGLVKYLPTTGVTVLLPAIIIHLLDIKAPEEETRRLSLRGFCQCMTVMGKLRDLYAAADYSVAFLEAAIRKAGIHVAPPMPAQAASPMPKPNPVNSLHDLVDAGRRLETVNRTAATTSLSLQRSTLTPPPDSSTTTSMTALEKQSNDNNVTDEEVARRLETFLASTPPESDHEQISSITISEDTPPMPTEAPAPHNVDDLYKWTRMGVINNAFGHINHHQDDDTLFSSLPLNNEFDDGDFDSLLNLDAVGETFTFDDSALDGGLGDIDWLGNTDVGISLEA
ncbi:hypothetical protein ACEQ8H_001840 [Pleosporales sp. CAS-2024a]